MQDPLSQGDVLPVMMLFCYTSIYTSVRSVAIDLLERATVYYPLYGRTLRDRLMFFCFLSSQKKSIYLSKSIPRARPGNKSSPRNSPPSMPSDGKPIFDAVMFIAGNSMFDADTPGPSSAVLASVSKPAPNERVKGKENCTRRRKVQHRDQLFEVISAAVNHSVASVQFVQGCNRPTGVDAHVSNCVRCAAACSG